jgi:transcriptional regulator with XRE-family HTH domain
MWAKNINMGKKSQTAGSERSRSAVKVVTGAQLRAARGLLNMSIAELAERTGLALNTIRRAEATNDEVTITTANMRMLVTVLENEGVIFLPADRRGVGVRFASCEGVPFQTRRRMPTGG